MLSTVSEEDKVDIDGDNVSGDRVTLDKFVYDSQAFRIEDVEFFPSAFGMFTSEVVQGLCYHLQHELLKLKGKQPEFQEHFFHDAVKAAGEHELRLDKAAALLDLYMNGERQVEDKDHPLETGFFNISLLLYFQAQVHDLLPDKDAFLSQITRNLEVRVNPSSDFVSWQKPECHLDGNKCIIMFNGVNGFEHDHDSFAYYEFLKNGDGTSYHFIVSEKRRLGKDIADCDIAIVREKRGLVELYYETIRGPHLRIQGQMVRFYGLLLDHLKAQLGEEHVSHHLAEIPLHELAPSYTFKDITKY